VKLAELHTEFERGVGIARISGEIDASNRIEMRSQLLDFVHNASWGLVLDLSALRYLDSAGIEMVLHLAQRLQSRQQQLRVVAPAETFVADVLETVRLREVVPVDEDVAEAIGALAPQA
jgi:anti-sigma B factor antagonist